MGYFVLPETDIVSHSARPEYSVSATEIYARRESIFISGLPPIVHKVEVKAKAFIECRNNGAPIPCPAGTVDAYTNGGTQVAIGAASLLVEEQQNWGKQ